LILVLVGVGTIQHSVIGKHFRRVVRTS